jgi:ribosomal protein S19E (S16A)
MTEFIITVEESKSKFIMKLLSEFDYVQVKRKKKSVSAEDKRILDGISEAVKELNQYKKGEIELQDADSYIEELKKEGYL